MADQRNDRPPYGIGTIQATLDHLRRMIASVGATAPVPVADACLASLEAVSTLVGAWRDGRPIYPNDGGPATHTELSVAPLRRAADDLAHAHRLLKSIVDGH